MESQVDFWLDMIFFPGDFKTAKKPKAAFLGSLNPEIPTVCLNVQRTGRTDER